jgi:hypothetical protein
MAGGVGEKLCCFGGTNSVFRALPGLLPCEEQESVEERISSERLEITL